MLRFEGGILEGCCVEVDYGGETYDGWSCAGVLGVSIANSVQEVMHKVYSIFRDLGRVGREIFGDSKGRS